MRDKTQLSKRPEKKFSVIRRDLRESIGMLVFGIFCILLFADMILYGFITEHFKGTAYLGKLEKGHYFVGMHGGYNEVSRRGYLLIRWQEYSLIFLAISVFISFLWSKFEMRKKKD